MRWICLTLLCLSLSGCVGVEVANNEEPTDRYQNTIAPMLEEWKVVVHDWEKAASIEKSDPDRAVDAKSAQTRMQNIIASWDSVSPPDKLREYHLWIRHAMDYEKEAFRVMAEYYSLGYEPDPNELKRLRNLATELWVMKDKALLKADDALRK
jgi:uncharacterized protein YceK